MGKPSTATHKTVWMFRSDDTDLVRFKGMLAQRYGTTVTTPVAIGEAIRIALAELTHTDSITPSAMTLGVLEELIEDMMPTVYGDGLVAGSTVTVQTRSGPYQARVIEVPTSGDTP